MATTTPNFGWSVPTSSDLVKNGATAIETLGDSIDASLVDLKGGTTGQVLAKATGTDMDFTWTTASSGSSNTAGKNVFLNSNFSIWQRGTSASLGGAGVVTAADRWATYTAGSATTISRQLTGDTTNLPFIQYCARMQRTLASADTGLLEMGQSVETINAIPFAGKTVTLSFYARAGANYSATSSIFASFLRTGTGTDQNYVATSYTGLATPFSQNNTLTTTWQRFTQTGTIAATATELAVDFRWTPTGVAGVSDYAEVTGVQLEIAGSASPYSPNTSTQQAELAACQRYFQKTNNQSEVPGTASSTAPINAINASTTLVVGVPPFKGSMRTSPTVTLYSAATGTSGKIRSGGADVTASAADVGEFAVGYISATGLTAGSNSTITYAASAEL
jgi:hypothetical protein